MWHNFKVQTPLKLDFLLDACMPKLPVLNKSCVVVISRNKREQRKKKDLWERELEHICCFVALMVAKIPWISQEGEVPHYAFILSQTDTYVLIH